MLRGLTNVSFWADDVAAATRWYAELLGIEPYFVRPEDGPPAYVEFRLGDHQDELGLIDRRYGPPNAAAGPLPQRPEVTLPLWLAILLGVFWLAVLVTVAFTVWRMVANLKALAASVQSLSERLSPELDRLSEASQQAADRAARLSERSARAADQR